MGVNIPSYVPVFVWHLAPIYNTCFFGPTWVSPPNDISIGSAVFVQLTRVTNTQTDTQTTLHATSVAIGRRIYARRVRDAD